MNNQILTDHHVNVTSQHSSVLSGSTRQSWTPIWDKGCSRIGHLAIIRWYRFHTWAHKCSGRSGDVLKRNSFSPSWAFCFLLGTRKYESKVFERRLAVDENVFAVCGRSTGRVVDLCRLWRSSLGLRRAAKIGDIIPIPIFESSLLRLRRKLIKFWIHWRSLYLSSGVYHHMINCSHDARTELLTRWT